MTKTRKVKNISAEADAIIRHHIFYAMGASLIPLLVLDIFVVTKKQLAMIKQLCELYEVDYNDTQGKAIVTSLTSSTVARLGARSLLKLIPGIGATIGGITVSVFAGASSYALGNAFKKHLENGGSIDNLDTEKLQNTYKEEFEKGKDVAATINQKESTTVNATEDLQEDFEAENLVETLKKIGELKESGLLTDEEFTQMKQRLIDKI